MTLMIIYVAGAGGSSSHNSQSISSQTGKGVLKRYVCVCFVKHVARLLHAELSPAQAPVADQLDTLSSTLPSADSVAPSRPAYTGPEVVEVQHGHSFCMHLIIVDLKNK